MRFPPLKMIHLRAGLSARDVARLMGSSESTVSHVLNGTASYYPSEEWQSRFAKATGATLKEVRAATRKTFRRSIASARNLLTRGAA